MDHKKTEQPKHKLRRDNVVVVADTSDLLQSNDSPVTRLKILVEQLRSNLQVLISPGDKQFKDVPKRVRLMLVSFAVPLLFAITKIYIFPLSSSLYLWAVVGTVLAVLTYLGVYWGVKGQVRTDSYFSVLPMPSLFVLANCLFLSFLFVGAINRVYLWGLFVLAISVFMTFLYILSLAINILNVSLFYTIPLSRLGESVAFISSIVTVFLGSYVVAETAVPMIVAKSYTELGLLGLFVLVSTFVLILSLWKYFVVSTKSVVVSVACLSLFLLVTLFVFVMASPYAWISAILQGMVAYVLLGFIIHKEQNTYKKSVVIEYIVVVIAALILVIWA